jgi:dihydroorotate dehydrogenase (fumarate)
VVSLQTSYLGLDLRNPVVASASPLSKRVDTVRRLEDAGAAAVVVYSLFEEQITHESNELDHYLHRGSESFSEAIDFFPDLGNYNVGPDGYLEHIRRLKAAVDIPIIGSLNGVSTGGWVHHARLIEDAGADALELNIYYVPTDTDLTGRELEETYVELVQAVRSEIAIPLAVKLSPYFTSMANMGWLLVEAGADALVLFNRFFQPDLDLDAFEVVPSVTLSRPEALRLPLRWIAILSPKLACDFAATSGITTGDDVLKALMAGASVGMMASELLRGGVDRVGGVLDEMQVWMEEMEYESVAQLRGSMSQRSVAEPAAFERANYLRALSSFDHAVP